MANNIHLREWPLPIHYLSSCALHDLVEHFQDDREEDSNVTEYSKAEISYEDQGTAEQLLFEFGYYLVDISYWTQMTPQSTLN